MILSSRSADLDHGFTRWKALVSLFAVALLLSANVCLFGTFEIYISNRAEFDSSYSDVLLLLLIFSLGFAFFLTLVGQLLPRRFCSIFCAFLLAVGLLLWIQGSFLKWGYGEFDGSGIDWRKFTWQGWIDVAVWASFLTLAACFHRRLSRQAMFLALVFIFIQSGFLVGRAVTQQNRVAPAQSTKTSYGEEESGTIPEELCRLSTSRNVFHVIMDGFQTDVFMELVEEEGLAEDLDGFSVYKENMSVGKRTVLCIPAIFSGKLFDGSLAESEYFRDALESSFHDQLFRTNFIVNLMPQITMQETPYTNHFPVRATYAMPRRAKMLRISSFLLDVSMFRQVPHFLKRFIYNDENWRLSSLATDPPSHASFHHKAFFRDYISRLEAVYSRSAYHFMHLMPPHPPFVTTIDGKYAGEVLPTTRDNYKIEARYILRLFMQFLDKLRSLGLYDSSIIILQGDHGWGFAPIFNGQTFAEKTGRISPLLILKPISASGPLHTSLAPSTIADIPATILNLLKLTHSYPGESLVRLDPSKRRDREFVFVTERSSRAPTLHRLMVQGSVFDTTSWHEVETAAIEREIRSYTWGDKLGFGITGNGEPYLTSGWSTTSATVHWNDGKSAEMTFGSTPPDRDVHLRILYFGHVVPGKVERQRFRMKINGVNVKEFTCTTKNPERFDIVIPRQVLQADEMVISFGFPDAVAPNEIGTGRDWRKLAMGIYRLETRLADP